MSSRKKAASRRGRGANARPNTRPEIDKFFAFQQSREPDPGRRAMRREGRDADRGQLWAWRLYRWSCELDALHDQALRQLEVGKPAPRAKRIVDLESLFASIGKLLDSSPAGTQHDREECRADIVATVKAARALLTDAIKLLVDGRGLSEAEAVDEARRQMPEVRKLEALPEHLDPEHLDANERQRETARQWRSVADEANGELAALVARKLETLGARVLKRPAVVEWAREVAAERLAVPVSTVKKATLLAVPKLRAK